MEEVLSNFIVIIIVLSYMSIEYVINSEYCGRWGILEGKWAYKWYYWFCLIGCGWNLNISIKCVQVLIEGGFLCLESKRERESERDPKEICDQ